MSEQFNFDENTRVSATKNLGRYNLMRDEKDWCVTLRVGNLVLNESWPEEDEPDIDVSPSELVDLIESRNESYLFKSSRQETREKIAVLRANMKQVEMAWATTQILKKQKQSAILFNEIQRLRFYLEDEE